MSDDVIKLLVDISHSISSAQSNLEDTLPIPAELDSWMDEFDIPTDERDIFRQLSAEADSAYSEVDELGRNVRLAIKKLKEKRDANQRL